MKKIIPLLLALALAFCSAAAAEDAAVPETRVFPVSAARAVRIENENAVPVLIYSDGNPDPLVCYIVPDGTALLRLEISIADDPAATVFSDFGEGAVPVDSLLDPERGGYVYSQHVPDPSGDIRFTWGKMYAADPGPDDPLQIMYYLVAAEDCLPDVIADMEKNGRREISWEYGEPAAESAPQAYILHVADQAGAPVPGVYANFCTDASCFMKQSDETGTIVFSGEPDVYHVQLLRVPQGYSTDPDFEMYTGAAYGEWVLRIRKD